MGKKSLLLVEGATDSYFIKELCKRVKIDISFDIHHTKGIDLLMGYFKTSLNSSQEYAKLWVMIDADKGALSAWQGLRHNLIENGGYSNIINKKSSLPSSGIILPDDPDDITVGIWIMPNNVDEGMLEDFLLQLVKEEDTLIDEVNATIEHLEANRSKHKNIYKEAHRSKARMNTWLAWQNQPGLSLGAAMKNRLFQFDHQLCKKFISWLTQLNNKL